MQDKKLDFSKNIKTIFFSFNMDKWAVGANCHNQYKPSELLWSQRNAENVYAADHRPSEVYFKKHFTRLEIINQI